MAIKLLLVGGGITSAATVRLLHSRLENVSITIWEKCNFAGGRFLTLKQGDDNDLVVDLGGQYITTSDEVIKINADLYSPLFNNGLITTMNNRIKGMKTKFQHKHNYVAVTGMKSIVDQFLNFTNCNVCYGHKLTSLTNKSRQWLASTDNGKEELFDIVVLNIPIPEIFLIDGCVNSMLLNSCHHSSLREVKYSSRFALGIFFYCDVETEYDSEYIDNDPVIRYIGTDSWKRNNRNVFRSAVIHTSIQFGEEYKNENENNVKDIILKQLEKHFPHWPQPASVVIHQWKYSQVLQPFMSKPGAVLFSEEPMLIAGGDGFIGSTFDQCLFSARKISEFISPKLEKQ